MTSPVATPEDVTPLPTINDLGREGRAFLLAWVQTQILCDRPVTAEVWRDAWAQAADYQTVVDARKVLAS